MQMTMILIYICKVFLIQVMGAITSVVFDGG
jgi:hypothetical protein